MKSLKMLIAPAVAAASLLVITPSSQAGSRMWGWGLFTPDKPSWNHITPEPKHGGDDKGGDKDKDKDKGDKKPNPTGGGSSSVPEIDPAGLGAAGSLVVGGLALLKARRRRNA